LIQQSREDDDSFYQPTLRFVPIIDKVDYYCKSEIVK
jgi:hypothetical protein